MKILVACEESQTVCIAFRNRGHEAYSCDIQDCSGGHTEWHIKGNVLEQLDKEWDLMIAFPPCTRLTNSGVKWLYYPPKGKTIDQIWVELKKGAEFYNTIRKAPIKKKAIENPIMHKHAIKLIGKINRQIVQPWWFGEKVFKATGFELINLLPLIPTNKLIPPKPGTKEYKEWTFLHRLPPSKERSKLRSKTFPGIANAMVEQWGSNKKRGLIF